MFKDKYISVVIAFLLIGVTFLLDYQLILPGTGESVEGRETEREDLNEESEGEQDWLKLLSAGGPDAAQRLICPPRFLSLLTNTFTHGGQTEILSPVPLFLMYCKLKIPFPG